MKPTYRDYYPLLKSLRLPCAYVDWNLLRRNAEQTLKRARGLPVRIASKSLRSAWIIKTILAEYPGFSGVLAYSAQEAAYLCEQGIDDILIAYPSVEPTDLAAVLPQLKDKRTICFMADHPEHIRVLSALGIANNLVIPIALDIDVSLEMPGLYFGVYRSPIRSISDLKKLVDLVVKSPGVTLRGLMAYEAQCGVADRDPHKPFRSAAIRLLKTISQSSIRRCRNDAVDYLRSRGIPLQFVNGGGTGSLDSAAADKNVTELAAGSAFFGPVSFDHFDHFKPFPAAGFALPVTRLPKRGFATCHGGGFIASGPRYSAALPTPFLPDGLSLLKHEGAGEVQTPLKLPKSLNLHIGDPVIFRHCKAGELAEHFNVFHIFCDGRVMAHAPTYRGDGHAFL